MSTGTGAPATRQGRRGSLWVQLLVVLVGVLVMAYPFTLGASPDVTCRGTVMQPGDTCAKAGDAGTQSYEQRAADVRNARPVIVVGGLLIAGFGGVLLRSELRRRSARP